MGYINTDIIKRHKIITHYPGDYHNGWNDAIDEILEDKPADVQEVKHAHWCRHHWSEATLKYCVCSNCDIINDLDTRYCPWCGAKMDEEDGK